MTLLKAWNASGTPDVLRATGELPLYERRVERLDLRRLLALPLGTDIRTILACVVGGIAFLCFHVHEVKKMSGFVPDSILVFTRLADKYTTTQFTHAV